MEKKCLTCNGYDKEGYINNMCNDCYDMFLDIGKQTKKQKKELENRRIVNGYWNK